MIWTFFKGMGIGLAVAVPFGPISVLCLRQAMVNGRVAGLASGLGVAFADGLYALMAALGFLLLADRLAGWDLWFRIFAGLFIAWIAYSIGKSRPPAEAQAPKKRRLIASFAATFFLTLANPTTIFTFIALFGGTGLAAAAQEKSAALILTAGAFVGSLAWWLVLTEFGVRLGRKIRGEALVWINRSAAIALLILAFIIILQAILQFFSNST